MYTGAISPQQPARFESVDVDGERLLKVTYQDGTVEHYRHDGTRFHKLQNEGG